MLLVIFIVSLTGVVQINSAIKDNPINLIVGALEVPVHNDMGSGVSVSQSVASRKEFSPIPQVNSEVRKWFVLRPAISGHSPHEEINRAGTNG